MQSHIDSVEQIVTYLYSHMDERHSLEKLSAMACFSSDHFNRIFRAVTGETIHEFERRMQLERAAFRLTKTPHLSITRIAEDAGYSSSNFAVAFKKEFGITPRAYRDCPPQSTEQRYIEVRQRIDSLRARTDERALEELDKRISIVPLGAMMLYYERYRGRYENLVSAWENFCMRAEGLSRAKEPRWIGISYDDPLIVNPDRCVYDLCIEVERPFGHRIHRIAPARYVSYNFNDQLSRLIYAYNELVAVWMPARGYRIGDGACLEVYRSGLKEDGSIALDICIPVQ